MVDLNYFLQENNSSSIWFIASEERATKAVKLCITVGIFCLFKHEDGSRLQKNAEGDRRACGASSRCLWSWRVTPRSLHCYSHVHLACIHQTSVWGPCDPSWAKIYRKNSVFGLQRSQSYLPFISDSFFSQIIMDLCEGLSGSITHLLQKLLLGSVAWAGRSEHMDGVASILFSPDSFPRCVFLVRSSFTRAALSLKWCGF